MNLESEYYGERYPAESKEQVTVGGKVVGRLLLVPDHTNAAGFRYGGVYIDPITKEREKIPDSLRGGKRAIVKWIKERAKAHGNY